MEDPQREGGGNGIQKTRATAKKTGGTANGPEDRERQPAEIAHSTDKEEMNTSMHPGTEEYAPGVPYLGRALSTSNSSDAMLPTRPSCGTAPWAPRPQPAWQLGRSSQQWQVTASRRPVTRHCACCAEVEGGPPNCRWRRWATGQAKWMPVAAKPGTTQTHWRTSLGLARCSRITFHHPQPPISLF